jgi:hypothetical protein
MSKLGIIDLLTLKNFDPASRAKIIRHKDPKFPAHELLRSGWLETYQSFQTKPVFDGVDFVISTVGLDGTKARFVGVYRVGGRQPATAVPLPAGCPYADWNQSGYYYQLERLPEYDEFQHRIVIEWGTATRNFHQWVTNKPVFELLPEGAGLLPIFRDYLDFTLTHDELRFLRENPGANPDWRSRLSAVAGIYLILASTSGAQYIGSATGVEGIWGRWRDYATTGHGGNILLRELMEKDSAYPKAFTYSVLQILPRSVDRKVVLEWERRYKAKLGSRVHGLNDDN